MTARLLGSRLLGACLLITAAAAAQAEPVEDFYRGKTIELFIGGATGGGYDLAGRTVAAHLGRHIPGNPVFVVRNLPGATSLIMTNQLYNVAKRDGTVTALKLKIVQNLGAYFACLLASGSAPRCPGDIHK